MKNYIDTNMSHWILLVLYTSYLCYAGCNEDNKYTKYALIRVFPQNEYQLQVLQDYKDPNGEIEILKRSTGVNDTFDVLVPNTRNDFLVNFTEKHELIFEVKTDNYGQTIEHLERTARRRFIRDFEIFGYNSYSAMQMNLGQLAKRYPHLVRLDVVGQSSEGRKLMLVKISSNPRANNHIIFIDAGIHAREWVAPAMAMYLINRLTMDSDNGGSDLVGIDWYILPLVNPDGYEFSRSRPSNRLWRKTRSRSNSPNCFGVDGNRNYGYKWGISGVSMNPCNNEIYPGPEPFSEPETKVVRDIMRKYVKNIKLYVSVHAYGQYLVYPWGYTGDFVPYSWTKLDKLARKVSRAVVGAGGEPFTIMSAGKWYPAAGGSDDFAYGAIGIPYAYTMELTKNHEFSFPEPLLKIALPQYYEGFRAFGAHIRREFGERRHSKEIRASESSET